MLCSVWDLWAPVPGVGGKEGLWDHRGWPRASVPMPLPCVWHSHPTAAPEGPTSLCPGAAGKAQRHGTVCGDFHCDWSPVQLCKEAERLAQEYCSIVPWVSWEETVLHYNPKRSKGCFFFFSFSLMLLKCLILLNL